MGLRNEDLQGCGRVALVGRHLLDGDVLGGHAVGGRRNVVFTQPGISFMIQKKPLNVITFGQTKSDNIDQMIIFPAIFILQSLTNATCECDHISG
jgi:hypothetical protein